MASKVSNGNGMAPPRPPFRRQGSSVAAGTPHPMTVALAPVPKVDYSVTKGGARTWAVLLVFMFLCSSLYTVFSAKEMGEMPVDLDGDGTPDYDDDIADEVAEQQKRNMRDTTPSSEEQRAPDRTSHDHHSHHEIKTADDEEDSEEEDELEATLFAGLRKKIEQNLKKVKKLVEESKTKHEENDRNEEKEEEEEERPQVKQRPRRRKGKKSRDVEEEEENEEKQEKPLSRKEKKRLERQRKREEEEEKRRQEEETQSEEEEEEREEEETEKEEEKENSKEEDDDNDDDEDEEKEDEQEEEKEEEEKEESEKEEETEEQPQRPQRKRHGARKSGQTPSSEMKCRRKHCPPADTAQPRKSLLKNKRPLPKHYQPLSPSDIESFEDDIREEEEDESEEENEREQTPPVQEVVAVKKYRSSGREAYKRHAITNRDDHRHRVDLDRADFLVEKHEYDAALALFDKVLRTSPNSPRAHFGKARAFDIRGEYSASERDVDAAISEYEQVVDNEDTPEALFRQAASRLIDRSRFRGHLHKCLQAHRTLIDRFPTEMDLQTDFALTFLMMKRHDDARKIFKDVLEIDPNNAIALAYYGYILKVIDNDIEGGVAYMRKGLKLGEDSIADAKFYYHFGHALMYLGRKAEAYEVYEKGAELGLFLSAQQRSMYNIEGLTGRPWWSLDQTGYTKHLKSLERQWVSIRHEAVRALIDSPEQWEDENEEITVDGHWLAFPLFRNSQFVKKNCERTPLTCAVLKEFREHSNSSKSDMHLSVLSSGASVLAHCGASNTRLQAHMGLVVPSEARIRVGPEQRGWKTGKFIIFDDSFEHEMHFDGASSSAFRLVLVIDLWHPEVNPRQRVDVEDE